MPGFDAFRLDDAGPIKVAEDTWWLGFADYEAGFSNNPYLIYDGSEAVLIDPGPGHPIFRDIILRKIGEIVPPSRIRFIVLNHQDPDLCGLVPYLENIVHPEAVVVCHPRTSLFIPYYGIRKRLLPVGDDDVLELRSGRRLRFIHTPYVHFAGSMMCYDEKTSSLFSSDVFAVFSRDWSLYADKGYLGPARAFLEHYIASREELRYLDKRLRKLKITRILPQHGGIIETPLVPAFLDLLGTSRPGRAIQDLDRRPSPEVEAALLAEGRAWLSSWMGQLCPEPEGFESLLEFAIAEGPSAVSGLLERLSDAAEERGVANPLNFGRVHSSDTVRAASSERLFLGIRNRFLSRQYSYLYGKSDMGALLAQGLQSFEARLCVLFADIRGFTAWSAEREPDEVVSLLSRFYELCSRVISPRGGRINKLLGDGVLAYFPGNRAEDCLSAAEELHNCGRVEGLLPVGIGIAEGEVILGDVGEEARLDYTILGAPVNLASRLCDLAGPEEIALDPSFFAELGSARVTSLRSRGARPLRFKAKPSDPEMEALVLPSTKAP